MGPRKAAQEGIRPEEPKRIISIKRPKIAAAPTGAERQAGRKSDNQKDEEYSRKKEQAFLKNAKSLGGKKMRKQGEKGSTDSHKTSEPMKRGTRHVSRRRGE